MDKLLKNVIGGIAIMLAIAVFLGVINAAYNMVFTKYACIP